MSIAVSQVLRGSLKRDKMILDSIRQSRQVHMPKKQREVHFTPKQREVLNDPSNMIIVSGGYGSGKTTVAFYRFLLELEKRGGQGIVTCFSTRTTREVITAVLKGLDEEYDTKRGVFTTRFGSFLLYGLEKISAVERLKGLSVSCWYADEVTDQLLEGCLQVAARLRSGSEPFLIWSTNPKSPNHWVHKRIMAKDSKGNKVYSHHSISTHDNAENLPVNYIERLELHPESSEYLRMVEGHWVADDRDPFASIRIEDTNTQRFDYCNIDPALGGGDYTAVTFYKRDHATGDIIALGKAYKKSIVEVSEQIAQQCKAFNVTKLFYENNGVGEYPYKYFKNVIKIPVVIPYQSTVNKGLRIIKGESLVRAGVLVLDARSDSEYKSQVLNYSIDAKHDDAPDSLMTGLNKIGWLR